MESNLEKLLIGDCNTTISVCDSGGKPKPLFQENIFGRFLRLCGFNLTIPGITGWRSFTQRSHNLITDSGHNVVALALGGNNAAPRIAIGSGNTSPTAADTGLESLVAQMYATNNPLAAITTTNTPNDTVNIVAAFSMTVAASIGEESIQYGGNMLARQTFTPFTVAVGDIVNVAHSVVC